VQATLLYNALVTTLTALLLGRWARAWGYDARVGAAVALSFGLGTLAWPYATYFLGEPTSALCLAGAGYALTRWRATHGGRYAWATGIALGGLIATVAAHALLLPIFALYAARDADGRWRRPDRASLMGFLLPLGIAGGLLAAYNAARFGSPFSTGYHFEAGEGWTTPLWEGLWGLLFSPYRGLIWYTPLSLAAALAWRDLRRAQGATAGLIAGVVGVLTGLYSAWWMWWGGVRLGAALPGAPVSLSGAGPGAVVGARLHGPDAGMETARIPRAGGSLRPGPAPGGSGQLSAVRDRAARPVPHRLGGPAALRAARPL
jgi:hypothetical protein